MTRAPPRLVVALSSGCLRRAGGVGGTALWEHVPELLDDLTSTSLHEQQFRNDNTRGTTGLPSLQSRAAALGLPDRSLLGTRFLKPDASVDDMIRVFAGRVPPKFQEADAPPPRYALLCT